MDLGENEKTDLGEIIETDDATTKMVIDWHLRAAAAVRVIEFLIFVGVFAFCVWGGVAYNIKSHTISTSIADTTYSRCAAAVSSGSVWSTRLCNTIIIWYEIEPIIWPAIASGLVLFVGVLTMIGFEKRLYESEIVNKSVKEAGVWTYIKLRVGINSAVNQIEISGVNPLMHLMRIPLLVVAFWMFTIFSTNTDVTAIAASIIFGFSYAVLGYASVRFAAPRGISFGNFFTLWLVQAVMLCGWLIAIWFYNAEPFIGDSDHYTRVVFWTYIVFAFYMIIDLLWDPITLAIRFASHRKNADLRRFYVDVNKSYMLIGEDDDEGEEETMRIAYDVQPLAVAFFLSNWVRELTFVLFFAFIVIYPFAYHMANSLPVVI